MENLPTFCLIFSILAVKEKEVRIYKGVNAC